MNRADPIRLAASIRAKREEERAKVMDVFRAAVYDDREVTYADAERAGDAFVMMQVEWLDELLDAVNDL